MAVPAIGRMEERNLVGLCHLDVVPVDDVDSMPDELDGNVDGDVVLKAGKSWSRIYLDTEGGLFTEAWRMVNGAQLSDATINGVIAKDKLALMPLLWRLKGKRYLVRMETKNKDALLMGRPETGATALVTTRTSGENPDSDRNEYRVVFSLTRRMPVPFHDGVVPEPDPGGGECPTLGELLAPEDWAAIAALLSEGQLDDAAADICAVCETLAELMAPRTWAELEALLDTTQRNAARATINLRDSAATAIASYLIAAGGSANLTAPDGVVKTTDASTTVMNVLSNGTANLPQSKIKYTNAAGSAAELAASNTDFASGTLRPATTVPRFTIFEPDGTTPNSYKDISTPSYTMVKALTLAFDFPVGDDTTLTHSVRATGAGSFTATTNDGSSGTITFSKNGGAFAAFSAFSLAIGDVIQVKRTTITGNGWVELTGTY